MNLSARFPKPIRRTWRIIQLADRKAWKLYRAGTAVVGLSFVYWCLVLMSSAAARGFSHNNGKRSQQCLPCKT